LTKEQPTGYQGVKWNEPIVYELGGDGRKGFAVPEVERRVGRVAGDVVGSIPARMRRSRPPPLPELSEPEVVRHFIRLSQETFGVDSGINVGVGTCTMKYSPKVNEAILRSEKVSELHPLQDVSNVQGVLEILYRFEEWLCEISGMDDFSLQPRGGAHAVFTNARIMAAFHEANGDGGKRDEIITTVLSHPCNAASPAAAGFKVRTIYPNMETGIPDIEAVKAAVSSRTAGMMITDPYDTGVFDTNLDEYIKIVHEAGGLVAIDQANANSVLGRLRIGDLGADLCQFNLHKSFSTPHASGGPGCSPIGVKKELSKFLPVPTIEHDGRGYRLEFNRPASIGKVAEFYGVVPNVLRAYAWILSMGANGLLEASEAAIINNNYLIKKLVGIRGVKLPWSGNFPLRLQEARFSLAKLKEDTGIGVEDFNRRIVDYGVQRLFMSHEPWIVPEPFTPEPSESSSKDDLDRFVEVMRQVCKEAYGDSAIFIDAPHNCSVGRVDLTVTSDPARWAMTWRAHLRKNRGRPATRRDRSMASVKPGSRRAGGKRPLSSPKQ
jgi:glycine dehydrogenase subunit 2